MQEFEIIYYLYSKMTERHRVKHVIDFSFQDGVLFYRTHDNYERLKIEDLSFLSIRKINH